MAAGIYIHIPFCDAKCPYCDFYSVRPEDGLRRAYLAALAREAGIFPKGRCDSVYFGGGTPSLLEPGEIYGVLSALSARFDVAADAEVTLECNPATASARKLRGFRDAGINRLSVGVQSTDDAILRGAGRRHSAAQALAALEDAVPQKTALRTEKVLRLSIIPTFNIRWLVPRLPQFHAVCPGVRIVFKPYRIDDDLLGDDVDCWIRLRRSASTRWPRHIEASYVIGKDLVMICHPSVAAQIRQPADVLRFELLHHANYPGNWALWLQAYGIDTANLRLGPGFDLGVTLIEAVEANLGVTVIQRCLIERELAEQRVIIPLARQVSTGRGYYLCTPRARTASPHMEAFRAWLFEQVFLVRLP